MTFSLIVATLGRHRELARLLDSLQRQTFKDFNVVIVDQNPPGGLDNVIRDHSGWLDVDVASVTPQGVSSARNVGLGKADGEIICFPDDDCWYAPYTLEKVAELFEKFPHVGGLVVTWKASVQKESPIRIDSVSRTGAFRRAGTLVQFYRKKDVHGIQFDPELGPGTSLPYGCGEDTDFLLQVLKRNVEIHRTSEVLVFHAEPDVAGADLKPKIDAYARGRMYLLRKHQFPLYVQIMHIVYPLGRLLLEGPKAWRYRKAMFLSRLKAFWDMSFLQGGKVR